MKEAAMLVRVDPVGDAEIKPIKRTILNWDENHCPFCNVPEGMHHTDNCLLLKNGGSELDAICEQKGFDKDKLRLNLGSGNVRFSNCLNMELRPHKDVDADIYADLLKGIPVEDETFSEVLFIHVIEHIERKYHMAVFDEIWRILKPGGRLIMGFPDAIENMKRFIDNKFGGRWSLYHNVIYGRQARPGDFHVTAMERQDVTDRLMSAGFKEIKYLRHSINVTLTTIKGDKLNAYL